MPRPTAIAFDHARAAEAVAALDRATAVLADVAIGRGRSAATALERFRGVYAEDLDRSDRELGTASGDARDALTALRQAIVAAAEAAHRSQAARADEQRSWDRAHAHPPPVGVR